MFMFGELLKLKTVMNSEKTIPHAMTKSIVELIGVILSNPTLFELLAALIVAVHRLAHPRQDNLPTHPKNQLTCWNLLLVLLWPSVRGV